MSQADDAPASPAPPSNEGARAGRGVIYIGLAKLYFIFAGALIEFRLPTILANTVFGAYGLVASAVSPINNVLVTGTIQAVSRFTAQQPEQARAVQAAGLRMHLWLGLPVALLFMLGAPLFAYFLHDPSKIGPLVLAGCIVGGYSFYAVFVGTANGTRGFHKQAGLDVCFATLRALGILGLAMAGFGVYGAISGWVLAVAVILVVAALVIGLPRTRERFAQRPLVQFFGSVASYLVLLNLLLFADVFLLKRFSAEWYAGHPEALAEAALRAAQSGASQLIDAAQAADGQVGFYRAVQNLARLSYQAIIAGMFVIFPLVSRSTFENDRETTRRYVHTTMRYSLIFATAIGVVLAANPGPMLDVVYPTEYAQVGASALMALALGNVGFCLFAIAGTILNGAGHTREAILCAAVTLAASVLANAFVVPLFPPGREMLLAAAAATSGAMILGAVVGGLLLARSLGAALPWRTPLRVLIGVLAALAVGRALPFSSTLLTLVEAVLVGLAYLAALVITGELGRADLRALASLGGRRRARTSSGGTP
ncbi:polysaccharide biosynthesis C-terminal domain-containing protein [Haliangium ochraceum]|uniref:Virulence factor MVIN family protein n=1 Tax=Haliangium ochraceum (strain DSM 14365 / JCM 11303 / SMP-2) TaxID=502025 RepID=D0LQE6_HALO1|nr:polysaccharide biosynthesis C-terminal domain-containing protein [Haliangium ochraceum]ACY18955.1 virulence factor MVIN family protein [Haliangium ochraceum DSM 14365]